jgi:hypothetical protein
MEDVYATLLDALEFEPPAEERRKPPCCDEDGRPAADEDVAAAISGGIERHGARPRSAPLTSCPSLVRLLRRNGWTQANPTDRRTYCDLRKRAWRHRSPSPLTPCQGEGRGFESRRPLQSFWSQGRVLTASSSPRRRARRIGRGSEALPSSSIAHSSRRSGGTTRRRRWTTWSVSLRLNARLDLPGPCCPTRRPSVGIRSGLSP